MKTNILDKMKKIKYRRIFLYLALKTVQRKLYLKFNIINNNNKY